MVGSAPRYHREPMLIPRQTLLEIDGQLRARSDESRLRIVSAAADVDPLDVVRAGSEAFGWAGFYSSPDGRSIGALGAARVIAANGAGRFEQIDAHIADLPPGTQFLTGFSFDEDGPGGVEWEGFPSAAAVLPEVTVSRIRGRSVLTVVVRPGSDGRLLLGLLSTLRAPARALSEQEIDHTVESRPSPADWRGLVGDAVTTIRAGGFEKVVLARTVIVRTPRAISPFDLVAQLRDRYLGCRVFGWQQGGSTFLGASPELLVSREGDRFQSNPLAGSARRGDDPDEDRRIGDRLLASTKDRLEHSIVVDDAAHRLGDIATNVSRPAEPILYRYATVQHLATPITGSTGKRLLDLVSKLHPTAAVGGAPRSAALAFIAKQEGVDRGWYSGGIGWAEPGGNGEIAVGLRSALVRGDHAIAYAGNGIVEGSDPEEELGETRLKLRPMLDLLTGH